MSTQLEILNEKFIPLENEESSKSINNKKALVGRIILANDFNRFTAINMLKKGLNIEVGSHTFVFGLQDNETPWKIIEKAPWHVMGFFVCLKWQDLQITINELDFSHSPYQVQIHDLSIDYLNIKNVRQIGERSGEVLAIEDPL